MDDAIALYNQSKELTERIGDIQGKAATLTMMAQLLPFTDKPDKYLVALKYLQEYEEIFQKLKSPNAETVKEIIVRVNQLADEESTQNQ